MRLTLVVIALAWSPVSGAAPKVRIAGAVQGGIASTAPLEAKVDVPLRLYAVVRRGRTYFTDAPTLRVDGRRIPKRQVKPLSALQAKVSWRRIDPRPHHVDTPPPNPGNPAYSNAVLFGPRHGKWLGYDRLEYTQTPVATGPVLALKRIPKSAMWPDRKGLGTVRYAVQVETTGWRASSPGLETVGRRGIGRSVFRVSVRSGDDLVGWLTSYFGVPNVFGSAGRGKRHQTALHQGADCADVIVGALRKAGAKVPFSSVKGLFQIARPVTEKLWMDPSGFYALSDGARGAPVDLRFGVDVKKGDILVIDYARAVSRRSWDHVGVIGADEGVAGRFDPADALYHMGYLYGLTREPAHRQGRAIVQVLRLKRRVARALPQ